MMKQRPTALGEIPARAYQEKIVSRWKCPRCGWEGSDPCPAIRWLHMEEQEVVLMCPKLQCKTEVEPVELDTEVDHD